MEIVIGLITVVLGVAIPVWLHRLAHPRRALRYRVEHSPMRDASGRFNDLQATYLTIWSVARADIPSAAFDAGRPLIVDLGTTILPGTFVSDPAANLPQGVQLVQSGPSQVALMPYLLPKEAQVSARMYTERTSSPAVTVPLIDIDVIRDTNRNTAAAINTTRRRSRLSAIQITLGVLIASVLVMAVGIGFSIVKSPLGSALGAPALFIAMLSTLVLAGLLIARLVRRLARRAETKRHQSATSP
jgi:hypothetical protein